VANSFLFAQQKPPRRYILMDITSRQEISATCVYSSFPGPARRLKGRLSFRRYDAQPLLIMSVKLRNSLATLALAFSSIAL
jgi:hypothetical protein